MDLDEAITVTKLNIQDNGRCYVMVGWHPKSFEMYIYTKENLWKGRFSPNRLTGFSRNLHMAENDYYKSLRRCLSLPLENYRYELKSGFFYWKRKLKDTIVMEGFLPVEVVTSPNTRPDLVDILISLNRHLKEKVNGLLRRFNIIKTDYQKCIKDTEDFLNLKVEMEKTICTKFLNLLNLKKAKAEDLDKIKSELKGIKENLVK